MLLLSSIHCHIALLIELQDWGEQDWGFWEMMGLLFGAAKERVTTASPVGV